MQAKELLQQSSSLFNQGNPINPENQNMWKKISQRSLNISKQRGALHGREVDQFLKKILEKNFCLYFLCCLLLLQLKAAVNL